MEGLDTETLSWAQRWIFEYGPRMIAAVVILLVGQWVAKLLKRLVRRLMKQARLDPNLSSFTVNLTYYGVMTLVVMSVLSQIGIATTSLVAVLGAAGLALGLALQGSLANFAAGILIVVFQPFKVGDRIFGAEVEGVVEEVQLFTTILRTDNNRTVTVPNSSLTDGNIVNYSTKGTLRVDLQLRLPYDADLMRVKPLALAVLQAHPLVLSEPAPVVGVADLAETHVLIDLQPWVQAADHDNVKSDLYEQLKQRLEAEGINLAPPQDIRVSMLRRAVQLEQLAQAKNS